MANEEEKLTGDGIGPGEIDWDAVPVLGVPGLDNEEPLPLPAGYPSRFDFAKMTAGGPIDETMRQVEAAGDEFLRIHGENKTGLEFRSWLSEYDPELSERYTALSASAYFLLMGAADATKSIQELYKDELANADMTVSEEAEWHKEKLRTDKKTQEAIGKEMGSYFELIHQLLRDVGLAPDNTSGNQPASRHKSPPPFGADGLAPFASNPVAFAATRALLGAQAWKRDSDGIPYFLHEFGRKDSAAKGRVVFHVLDPASLPAESADIAAWRLANDILERFGPATARLHMMMLAYAASSDNGFTLDRQAIYKGVGVHRSQRRDLKHDEQERKAQAEVENLRSFGYTLQNLELTRKKGKKKGDGLAGDKFTIRQTNPAPFWNIEVIKFGQGTFLDDAGKQITKDWEDWEIKVTPGKSWAEAFLHGDDFRMFGFFSQDEFDKWASRSLLSFALWTRVQFQSRISQGQPVTLTNRQILEEPGTKLDGLTKHQHRRLKNQVARAIEEMEEAGWGVSEHSADTGTKRWEDFLAAKTTFTPPALVRERYASLANKTSKKPALKSGRNGEAQADVGRWTPTKISELIERVGSGAQLAKILEVSPAFVSWLKSGARAVSAVMAAKLDKAEKDLDRQAKK